MDGWNTTFLLGFGLFSGAFAVSFREGNLQVLELQVRPFPWTDSAGQFLGYLWANIPSKTIWSWRVKRTLEIYFAEASQVPQILKAYIVNIKSLWTQEILEPIQLVGSWGF